MDVDDAGGVRVLKVDAGVDVERDLDPLVKRNASLAYRMVQAEGEFNVLILRHGSHLEKPPRQYSLCKGDDLYPLNHPLIFLQ